MQNSTSDYILGHQEHELERLMQQAKIFGAVSQHLLELAGIAPGMDVLDLGCGPGDVSFLAARLVGPRGTVLGVDASEQAIALAKRRAKHLGIDNVQFLTSDITRLSASELDAITSAPRAGFDALIGRLVLMYLPDPPATLRRLMTLLRPGAVVAFQEFDIAAASCEPHCELFETTVERIQAAFVHGKFDLRFGIRQGHIFRAAGLPAPEMRMEGRVESALEALSYDALTQVTRTLLPLLIRAEIATEEEIGIDTLSDRLREECVRRDATITYVPLVGAWTRVPAQG
jgi:ubiquinone/menaquinone biosynthesis C-methylase UbiE